MSQEVTDRYNEIFDIEIEGWCYGLTHFPGEVHQALVHRVIKEVAPAFKAAIEHNYIFSVLDVSEKFSRAAKYLIHEQEIAFSILAQLPNPMYLNEDQQFVLAQIVDQVEQQYGGALSRLQRKWSWEQSKLLNKVKDPNTLAAINKGSKAA